MKIIPERPPFYERVVARFPEIALTKNAVFTYGDVLYNPSGNNPPPYLIVHESVHMEQQARIGKDEWWDRFIGDEGFRLQQELEAYQAEYKAFCKMYRDRNERNSFLRFQALMCSSAMYGKMITFPDALTKIKNDHAL